jgi:hypothetical protein
MQYAKEKHLADEYVRHLLGRALRENTETDKITNIETDKITNTETDKTTSTLKIMIMAYIICNSQRRWEKVL